MSGLSILRRLCLLPILATAFACAAPSLCSSSTAAGGRAQLLLSPPLDIDGHHIHHRPDRWRAKVAEYLRSIGVTSVAAGDTAGARKQEVAHEGG